MHVVAVIPARGGSKGIPLKNLAELAGKPLISYVIETCLAAESVERTVVSTDHERIAEVARRYGAEVTLDPVIYHAVTALEAEGDHAIDVVLTVQPTVPLLRPSTIDRAVRTLLDSDWDAVTSVRETRHLYWHKVDGEMRPLFQERVNRQPLDPLYYETGAVFACRRDIITPDNRLGTKIGHVINSEEESIDIDTELDLYFAELLITNGLLDSKE